MRRLSATIFVVLLCLSPEVFAQSTGSPSGEALQLVGTSALDIDGQDSTSEGGALAAQPEPPGAPLAARLTVETLLGGGAGMVTAGLVAIGAVFDTVGEETHDEVATSSPLWSVAIFGAYYGTVPLGVYGAGRLFSGRGKLGATYLGSLAGAATSWVFVGLAFLMAGEDTTGQNPGVIAAFGSAVVLPALGGAIGYEMSRAAQRSSSQPPQGLLLVPSVEFDPRREASFVGIGGRF